LQQIYHRFCPGNIDKYLQNITLFSFSFISAKAAQITRLSLNGDRSLQERVMFKLSLGNVITPQGRHQRWTQHIIRTTKSILMSWEIFKNRGGRVFQDDNTNFCCFFGSGSLWGGCTWNDVLSLSGISSVPGCRWHNLIRWAEKARISQRGK